MNEGGGTSKRIFTDFEVGTEVRVLSRDPQKEKFWNPNLDFTGSVDHVAEFRELSRLSVPSRVENLNSAKR
jgi:hypothetical protein